MARKVSIPGIDVPFVLPGGLVNPDWQPVLQFLQTLQPLSDIDNSAITAAIALKSDITRGFGQSISGSVTLALSDAGKILISAAAGAHNITVPPNSSVAFDVGTQIDFIQFGAGQPTFVAGSGVTIFSKASYVKISAQYAAATLVKGSTNGWYLLGDLSA